MTNIEIAKEIVIAMIQNNKIGFNMRKQYESPETSYTDEVCRTLEAVYQTISKLSEK